MDALGWAHRAADRRLNRLEAAACLALFVTGVYATSFGPALPILAADFGVSLDRAGLLLSTLFFGSIIASTAMATSLHRFDQRALAAAGLAAVGVGCLALGFAEAFAVGVASVVLIGAGDGLLVAAVHTLVSQVSRDVAKGINRINLYFAVGAIVGPLWTGAVLAAGADQRALVYAGIAALAFAGGLFTILSPKPPASRMEDHADRRLSRLTVVMGLVLFLYVGAEFGLGSWVATYSDREFDAGIFAGAVVTAGYWGALMVGRIVSGWLFGRGVSARRVLLGSIALGMVTSAGIAAANQSFGLAVAAAFATGLAFGPIWPAAMAIAAGSGRGNAPAAMVTIGNSGGLVFPWVQGHILVSAGAATGIAMSAVLCAGMLTVAWLAPRSRVE
ncbi:MAG: MFS transporter [bacterium]